MRKFELPKVFFLLGCLIGGLSSALVPWLFTNSQADTKLLPFQGRLTDATGAAVADGAKVVEFKLYDAPTGGNVKWAGEVHKLSVNGGLVNTMLGSKAGLGGVDFSTPTFLQITVDANADGSITAADPPLLPRQSIIAGVFASEAGNARDSVKLAGADWSSIMVDAVGAPTNAPGTGLLNGAKIRTGTVAPSAIASSNGITVEQLGTGSVGTDEIINGSIQAVDLSTSLQNGVTPVGAISAYILDTAPPGWLLCDGHEELNADYPSLATALGTKFGQSSAPGTGPGTKFVLPDLRGVFLRGRNAGRTGLAADPDVNGRLPAFLGGTPDGVGSTQGDAFQGHWHDIMIGEATPGTRNRPISHNAGWKNLSDPGGAVNAAPSSYSATSVVTDVVNGTPRVTSETRPKNIYVNYIIKY